MIDKIGSFDFDKIRDEIDGEKEVLRFENRSLRNKYNVLRKEYNQYKSMMRGLFVAQTCVFLMIMVLLVGYISKNIF